MKRYITLVLSALAFWACSNDDGEPAFVPATLELTPAQGASVSISPDGASGTVSFPYQHASVTIDVATNQKQWTFSLEQPAEHFSVSRTDNSITITVPENKTSLSFEATLTLSAGSESNFARCVLSLSQQPTPDPEVSVDPQSVHFPYSGGQTEIAVSTNRERWTIRKTNDSFIAIKSDGKIIIRAPLNKKPETREGTVIVTAGEGREIIEAEIPVTQEAAPRITVSVDKTSVGFTSEGGTETVTVTVENADEWSFECKETWLNVNKEGDRLVITAPVNHTANTPTAEITVYAGSKKYNYDQRTITVGQEAWENAGALVFELTIPEGGVTALLPLTGLSNCTIDWGDGSAEEHPTEDIPSHVYAEAGVYEAAVKGGVNRINSDASKFTYPNREAITYITAIVSWGNTDLKSMERAFYKCANLKSVPDDTEGAFANVTTFREAFCKSGLESIPGGLLAHAKAASKFYGCFQDCEALTTIPGGLFDNCESADSFYATFYSCGELVSVPDGLFAGRSKVTEFSRTFGYNPKLETVGKNVFKGCTENTSFNQVFYYCGKLESVPADIFDDCRKVTDFRFAFGYNKSMTGESPYTTVNGTKVHLYERNDYPEEFTAVAQYGKCFTSCTGLSDYEAIVAAGWNK